MGVITGDLNGDGFTDLFVSTWEGTETLHSRRRNLEGRESNRDGYGAKVRIHVGGQTFVREIDGGSSHLSHSSTAAHFGLADYSEIDKIEVIWAGGKVQEVLPSKEGIFDGSVNQHIHIIEGEGDALTTTALTSVEAAHFQVTAFPNPFSQSITLQYTLNENAQVSAAIYNASGSLVAHLLPQMEQSAGQHELEWNGKDAQGLTVPFGTYFCRLKVDNEVVVQKVVYLRE